MKYFPSFSMMKLYHCLVVSLLTVAAFFSIEVYGYEIEGQLITNVTPKDKNIPSQALQYGQKIEPYEILLNGGEYVTYAQSNGHFAFHDLPAGRYVVDIVSSTYLFSQFKIDISNDGTYRAIEYKYPGAPKERATYPLIAEQVTSFKYFEPREKFNLLAMLLNPQVAMILIPVALIYLLPKLSGNLMDPEELKKAQEEMGGNDPNSLLANFMGGGASKVEDSDEE